MERFHLCFSLKLWKGSCETINSLSSACIPLVSKVWSGQRWRQGGEQHIDYPPGRIHQKLHWGCLSNSGCLDQLCLFAVCMHTYVYACTCRNPYIPSVFDTVQFVCLLGSFTYVSVLPGTAYASGEQSNVTVPAEVCEQLSFSAKANTLCALMSCHFSFTLALLQYCIPQPEVLGGWRKKDGLSRGYGLFQTGSWKPSCYLRRNVTLSSIHICQQRSHYTGCAWKFSVYILLKQETL